MSYGEPDDVPGECSAKLFIVDNYGDNHATMRCGLPDGHEGLHVEKFKRKLNGEVTITWERGEPGR